MVSRYFQSISRVAALPTLIPASGYAHIIHSRLYVGQSLTQINSNERTKAGCRKGHESGTLRSVRIHGALRTFDTGIYRGDRTRIAGLAGADGSLMNRERLRR